MEFTRATLAHDAAADEYREAIVKRWGRRALVSLAFAITAARIYSTTKYETGTESLSTSLKLMLASFGNNVAIVNLLPSSDWLAVGGGVDRRETRCVEVEFDDVAVITYENGAGSDSSVNYVNAF